MSSQDTSGVYDDDDDKLIPAWGQSSDNQIIWLGLLVAALMGLTIFGLGQCSGDDVNALGETIGVTEGAGSGESVGDLLDRDLSGDLLQEGDIDLYDLDKGPYTVFAPEDAALDTVDLVAAGAGVAGYHVVKGRYTESELTAGTTLKTVGGDTITIAGDGTLNNGVEIIDADQHADNGIVHTISGVLEDEAAAPVPTAEPTAAPEATAVPEPEPTAVPPTPVPTAVPAAPAAYTIADLAGDNGLTTLGTVAAAVGLGDAIADPDAGPFTVFAPTEEAFAETAELAGRLTQDQLDRTVRYHIVEGVYTAEDLPAGTELTTIQGETLTIGANGTVNVSSMIISADNEADNGIVHVIDNLLVPDSVRQELVVSDLNELFQLEPIQFAKGSAEILPESQPTLDRAIEILSGAPASAKVEIGGHTDSDGGDDSNQTLSENRANSVLAYLTNGGVDATNLTAKGYGETQLKIDPETSAEDKAQNRRIEFKILDEG